MFFIKSMPQTGPPTQQKQWKVGDRVEVDCSLDLIEELQDGHGGWGKCMEEALTNVGTVCDLYDDGDIEVSYPSGSRWTFNPAIFKACALKQVSSVPARKKNLPTIKPKQPPRISTTETRFSTYSAVTENLRYWKAGDRVKITLDQKALKELQLGHGGWDDSMQEALTSVGIVSHYEEDGDIEVSYPSGNRWTFNPTVFTSFNNSSADSIINKRVSQINSEQIDETQINKWKKGTLVEINLDEDIVQALQTGYEWEAGMVEALSSIGEVVDFDGNTGGLIVSYDSGKRWLFNPQVFVLAEEYSDDIGNPLDCKKCFEKQRQIIFMPCNHLAACFNCADEVKRCLICREAVQSFRQLEKAECMVCSDKSTGVLFKPCNHAAACIGCSRKMKKCIVCKEVIIEKINLLTEFEDEEAKKNDLLETLQKQVEELKDQKSCVVCLDNKTNIVFKPCGHGSCQICSNQLQNCPICRKPIEDKIEIFL